MINLKLTDVDCLKENDIIASPVMTNEFQILLSKGTILKKEYIDKLKELGISEVYIEDDYDCQVDEEKVQSDSQQEKQSISVELKRDCADKIKEILKYHVFGREEELSKFKEITNEILEKILNNPEVVQNVCEIKERKPDIYQHTLSLCCTSMMIALRMNMDMDEVKQLGTAALLHDLGLRYTTMKYENVELNSLSEEDREEYKKHTIYGYSVVSESDWLSEQEKKMILFHHENLAGLGYPLHSDRLSVLTQILAVCEIMDEMICGIGYKRKKVWEVLSYLKEIKGKYYYSEIIDAINSFIAVYPVGTKLTLDDGSIGIVVKQGEKDPSRPVIQIIKKGKKIENVSKEAVTLVFLEKDSEYQIVQVEEH
jgi:HD-GYP domain-containing protein (c-di-GMP phosphodiesterase class II)